MSIYFLRHIKTTYNQDGIISGCADAEVIPGQSLVLPPGMPVYFNRILSSPLKRCQATIELLPNSCYDSIEIFDCLIERNVGILEGLSKKVALTQYPFLFCDGKIDVDAIIPNGESISEVAERISIIAKEILLASVEMNILVCSHNQTLKVLFAILRKIPLTNNYWKKVNFKNGVLININKV
ncbi:MAG: histidine phosphatase family protein [Allobaculum sp.]|nr:histidine phosphatase family protein [Allobaculum sp.]